MTTTKRCSDAGPSDDEPAGRDFFICAKKLGGAVGKVGSFVAAMPYPTAAKIFTKERTKGVIYPH